MDEFLSNFEEFLAELPRMTQYELRLLNKGAWWVYVKGRRHGLAGKPPVHTYKGWQARSYQAGYVAGKLAKR